MNTTNAYIRLVSQETSAGIDTPAGVCEGSSLFAAMRPFCESQPRTLSRQQANKAGGKHE